jgi:hypothetical protein
MAACATLARLFSPYFNSKEEYAVLVAVSQNIRHLFRVKISEMQSQLIKVPHTYSRRAGVPLHEMVS